MAESQVSPESSPVIDQILNDPQFQQLTSRKAQLSLLLTLVTMVCYFSFVILLATGAPLLAQPVNGATLGIPLGIGLIFLGWIVTGIYVRWANASYDAAVIEIRARYFGDRADT